MEKEDDRQEAQIWKKLSKRFEEEAQIRIAAEAAAEKAAENKVCMREKERERERECARACVCVSVSRNVTSLNDSLLPCAAWQSLIITAHMM